MRSCVCIVLHLPAAERVEVSQRAKAVKRGMVVVLTFSVPSSPEREDSQQLTPATTLVTSRHFSNEVTSPPAPGQQRTAPEQPQLQNIQGQDAQPPADNAQPPEQPETLPDVAPSPQRAAAKPASTAEAQSPKQPAGPEQLSADKQSKQGGSSGRQPAPAHAGPDAPSAADK